jgi:acyl carrier protein
MFASASQQARAAWQARGVVPMSSQRALAGLERILAEEDAFAIVAQIEWSRARSTVAAPIDASPTQVTLVIEPMHGGSGRPDALAALRSQPASFLRRALVELLAASARRVLGLANHVAIDAASPLKNLGLDSLMAIELRNELARLGGVSLPATLVFDLPTLDALADRLAVVWSLAPSPAGRPATRSVSEPDELDELSEEDAEALLAVELDALAAVSSKSKVNI